MCEGYIMKRFILLLLMLPVATYASPIETWTCTQGLNTDVLVVAYVNKGRETGTIKVAGVTHNASFSVQGFERRWDFGLTKDKEYTYAFLIQPNGTATYYDFSDVTKGKKTGPKILMSCKMVPLWN